MDGPISAVSLRVNAFSPIKTKENQDHIMGRVPLDALQLVFANLGLKELGRLARTCQYLDHRVKSPSTWKAIFNKNFRIPLSSELKLIEGPAVDYKSEIKKRVEVARSAAFQSFSVVHRPLGVFSYNDSKATLSVHGIEFTNAKTGKQVGVYSYDELTPFGIKFTQMGNKLYVTRIKDPQGYIDVLDIETGRVLKTYSGLSNNYAYARTSPICEPIISNGHLIAQAQHYVRVWNIETGELVHSAQTRVDEKVRAAGFTYAVIFGVSVPMIRLVMCEYPSKYTLCTLNLALKTATRMLIGSFNAPPDGDVLLIGPWTALKFRNPNTREDTWKVFCNFKDFCHDRIVRGVDVKDNMLTIIDEKGIVSVWDIHTEELINEFATGLEKVVKIQSRVPGVLAIVHNAFDEKMVVYNTISGSVLQDYDKLSKDTLCLGADKSIYYSSQEKKTGSKKNPVMHQISMIDIRHFEPQTPPQQAQPPQPKTSSVVEAAKQAANGVKSLFSSKQKKT
jgi:hypothetical protein